MPEEMIRLDSGLNEFSPPLDDLKICERPLHNPGLPLFVRFDFLNDGLRLCVLSRVRNVGVEVQLPVEESHQAMRYAINAAAFLFNVPVHIPPFTDNDFLIVGISLILHEDTVKEDLLESWDPKESD